MPAWLKFEFMIARWAALDNVRKLIGIHKARYLVTGAAPISPDLIHWYLALGVPMFEVWGMTETAGLSTSMVGNRIKPGTIGKAAPFNEVRIDEKTGEILVRVAAWIVLLQSGSKAGFVFVALLAVGNAGGRVVAGGFEGLPFDLIQEWGFGRSPFTDLGKVNDEPIVHAVTDAQKSLLVGITSGHLFTVDFEGGKISTVGELPGGGNEPDGPVLDADEPVLRVIPVQVCDASNDLHYALLSNSGHTVHLR